MTLLIIVIVLAGGWFGLLWLRRKWRLGRAGEQILDSVFLEVLVPKDLPREERELERKEETEMIAVAEQLFATLSHSETSQLKRFLTGGASVSFEIVNQDQKIAFYINCPKRLRDLVEKQIHAQYPTAQIEQVAPPSLAREASVAMAYELGLQKKYIYPVKTYKLMESDPLNALTTSLSKLSAGEAGAIQLVISPTGFGWRTQGNSMARRIQKGQPLHASSSPLLRGMSFVGSAFGNFISDLFASKKKNREFLPQTGGSLQKDELRQLTPMQQEAVKRLEEKASKSGFEANLRIVVASTSREAAQSHLRNILSAFMQYSQPPFNGFRVLHKSPGKILRDFVYRSFEPRLLRRMILNTEELTSLFHLPTPYLETPHIKWLMSKRAPAPVNLPSSGLLLGYNVYRGIRSEIRILDDDRRRHMYVIGRTGTGKSEFLKNLARQDIEAGHGVAVIDPHGDLVDDLLHLIPRQRADDVILFEPFDMERPMGLNMLEAKTEEEKDFAVQEMIAIFYKLFPPEMIGPMFEHNMRNAMLTLMADREAPGTIVEIPRMFTDSEFQKYKLMNVTDPVVRNFWEQEMAKTSEFHKSEMLGYLISKVGRFVENEMMRNIIGQSHSAFDFRQVMDEGKVLLINLSKGKTGEVNSTLLGLILVSKLQMAALSRADLPERERRDFYLYIDEFQNFVTDSLATILSEARKYHLNLIMAHQYISQLVVGEDTKIRDAVFGNAGTMMSFRIGVEDAEIMAKEFEPVFNAYDLVNIDRFHAYVKLMINGSSSRPFNMQTLPPPEPLPSDLAEGIRKLSKLKYGRPKAEVEAEIMKRSRLGGVAERLPNIERSL